MVVTTGRTTSRDTDNVYAAAHLYIQFRATVGKLRSEATPRRLKRAAMIATMRTYLTVRNPSRILISQQAGTLSRSESQRLAGRPSSKSESHVVTLAQLPMSQMPVLLLAFPGPR